jgi:hypothetical protein
MKVLETPLERPKGVIGQWYTLTSDYCFGSSLHKTAGYTWQCKKVFEGDGSPIIDDVWISSYESYRLATPEEIAAAQSSSVESGNTGQPLEEYDFVNPKHYQEFSVEVIDMMAAIWGKEATALHCEMCAFKYRLRIGSKPNQSIEDELGKINWYMEKAKELRDA